MSQPNHLATMMFKAPPTLTPPAGAQPAVPPVPGAPGAPGTPAAPTAPGAPAAPAAPQDAAAKLAFMQALQGVTNAVHAASNIDEIMTDVTPQICRVFNADRLTIYAISDDKTAIISKVKTGLNSFQDIKLPISQQSIAGCAALLKRTLNIRDVYDDAELKRISPNLQFLKAVDQRTGYRTKQMLVAPILRGAELLGVVQIINHKKDEPFPVYHVEGVNMVAATLAIAFANRQQATWVAKTKYDYIALDKHLAPAEFQLAQREAKRKGVDLEATLIKDFQVKPEVIGASLAKFFGVPYEPFRPDRIKPLELLKPLKREYIEGTEWLPIDERPEGIVIMALDPERIKSSRIANTIFPKHKLAYVVTTRTDFTQTVDQFFGGPPGSGGSIGDILSGMAEEEGAAEATDITAEISAAADNEVVKLVNQIIIDGYNQKASDIHIEPYPGKQKLEVRFRKDGTLVKYIDIPPSYGQAIAARIKIMCDLDISEKRKPQDGKIKFKKYGPLDIELRVATIPTQGGVEDIVMRILAAGEPIPLDSLGVLERNLEQLKAAVSKPYGLFFVCGPTGSGKTTTLHSVLGFLNTPETKIWTAEDPVEITQKGLRQVQVNKKAGMDFATVMKAFLRADPDIIMVGEMRDKETTSIGIEASLTGHLVFATLHTNSAPESIIRLLDMGMDPFNFADALLGVLAQRLGKRLCKECKEAYTPSEQEFEHLLDEYTEELRNTQRWKANPAAAREAIKQDWLKRYAKDGKFTLYRAKGCATCDNTGYKGRVGLHELLVGTDPVKKLIQEHARVAEILACALETGMTTLKMDGIAKVLLGLTDLKQVRAVCIK